MDIGPTILRAQGLEIPEKFGGHPLQEQISREWQRTVSYSRYFSKSAFIFSDGYKLICYGNECRGGLEVFNLKTDPLELRNLANLKPDLAYRMRAEAFQWKSNHVVFDVETSALDGASLADDAEALRALGYLD
jgi:arylsulfatase A-like enzyme